MDKVSRIEAGKGSALYRQWILKEWAAESPGERELTRRQRTVLQNIIHGPGGTYGPDAASVPDMLETVALWGYDLLQGELPDALK